MANKNNSHLNKALKEPYDEYYTRYEDIEKELVYYEDQLRGKTIYCNCDDVRYSNFLEYICRQAPHIGIRRVIGSHYDKGASQSYYVTFVPPPNLDNWDGDRWQDYLVEMPMEGDGDFRSEASIRLLRQADVVITNPPYSLFREYTAQLIKYNKQFLIIGPKTIVARPEIFNYIKENKLWCGYNSHGTNMYFRTTENKRKELISSNKHFNIDGEIMAQQQAVYYTNLYVSKRHVPQDLFLSMEKHDRPYLKYDNANAYNVDKIIEIPYDSGDKILGVPITWLLNFCPDQFDIISFRKGDDGKDLTINGHVLFNRVLIRRRQ